MSVEQPDGKEPVSPPTTVQVATQPIGTGQPEPIPTQDPEQQASVGAVAAPGPSLVLTVDQGPPEYSEVVKQMSQGVGPVQQPGQPPPQQGLPQFEYNAQQPQGPGSDTQQPPPPLYMVQAPMATSSPPHSSPHDFLILAVLTAGVCCCLNLTSLSCGIPAIVFALASRFQKDKYANFTSAKTYGSRAIALTVACIVWTLSVGGLTTGLIIWNYYNPDSGFCKYAYDTYTCNTHRDF